MNHEYIDDHALPEQYAAGRLPSEVEAGFEAHLIDCERCLDAIDAAEQLAGGLREQAVRLAAPAPVELGLAASLGVLSRQRSLLALAAGVLFALLIPTSFMLMETGRMRGELDRLRAPQVNVPVHRLGATRSDDAVARIETGGGESWLALAVEVEAPWMYDDLAATLVDAGGTVVWSAEGLLADADDTVAIRFHGEYLAPGRHELVLEGAASGGEPEAVGSFTFEIVEPGSR